MREQATWQDLARIHNVLADVRTLIAQTLRNGVTERERQVLEGVYMATGTDKANVGVLLSEHPAADKQRRARGNG